LRTPSSAPRLATASTELTASGAPACRRGRAPPSHCGPGHLRHAAGSELRSAPSGVLPQASFARPPQVDPERSVSHRQLSTNHPWINWPQSWIPSNGINKALACNLFVKIELNLVGPHAVTKQSKFACVHGVGDSHGLRLSDTEGYGDELCLPELSDVGNASTRPWKMPPTSSMVRVGELVPGHHERAGAGELDLGRRGRARASLTPAHARRGGPTM
jgi:hypothetical protein